MSESQALWHKIIDFLDHIWPYVTAFFLSIFASIKLALSDRKDTKTRIKNLEILALNYATKEELNQCRDEVDKQDYDNLDKIYTEIKEIKIAQKHDIETNSQQHQDLLRVILSIKDNQ